ncbi:MAG: class I SAM-dependent methyltransferase [Candidatus Paceibacteria bacterium]
MSFLDPKNVLSQVPISTGSVVADFGAGSGYFTIEAAKRANPGTVYAIDIMEEPLENINSKAQTLGLNNVKTIRADLEKVGNLQLDNGVCDLVIVSNILFQVKNRTALMREAQRVLKKEGFLLLIEWVPEKMLYSKGLKPIGADEARKLAETAGFVFEKSIDAGTYHYGFLFKRP